MVVILELSLWKKNYLEKARIMGTFWYDQKENYFELFVKILRVNWRKCYEKFVSVRRFYR